MQCQLTKLTRTPAACCLIALYFTVPHGFPWTPHGVPMESSWSLMESSWSPHGVLVDSMWTMVNFGEICLIEVNAIIYIYIYIYILAESHTYKLISYIYGSTYLFFLFFNVNTFFIFITFLVVPQPLLSDDLLCVNKQHRT